MSENRFSSLLSILKGLLIAILLTLIGMAGIALLAVFVRISDSLLSTLNQLLKIIAIAIGTHAAVGRAGNRGFVKGAVLALIYMIAGYGLYIALGGGAYSTTAMLGEMLFGAAIGGTCGAILSNMRPKKVRRRVPRSA